MLTPHPTHAWLIDPAAFPHALHLPESIYQIKTIAKIIITAAELSGQVHIYLGSMSFERKIILLDLNLLCNNASVLNSFIRHQLSTETCGMCVE